MPLNLYISNDIEKLAIKLANNVKSQPLNLFQKEIIIVQTEGMSSWISVKISEENKVFANFDFLSPNKILFELFRLAGIYNSGMYDTNNLKWIIYKIIGSNEFKSKFNSAYLYFKNDKIKQLQLATKLSDLYDQYVIYRPDYIRLWNEGKSPILKNNLNILEKWQQWVWQQIKENIGKNTLDKVQMRDQLLEKFKDPDFISKVKMKFPRISLFGFSIFTLFHIEVFLSALKDIIDVEFYLTNPSPQDYWFKDIKEKTKIRIEKTSESSSEELKLTVGNQLLMNQGKTAKDLYNMLFDIDEVLNVLDNESFVNPPNRDSLLHIIQNDIYYNTSNEDRVDITEDSLNDGSIQVVSNYTAIREVETLYNYILKQVKENKYKFNDFIVQTTNIDLYTPIIKAVFDNASIRIPYIIADRSYAGNDNLISIIKQLLSLHKDEFTSESILQLLDFSVIRKKFDISNIKIIRAIVKMANIRHGISGKKENDTIFISWKYGLERILLGYAIKSDSYYNSIIGNYDINPLELVEGEYAKEGLKLKLFVDTLIYFTTNRSKPRKLSDWREYIFNYLNQILEVKDDKLNELNYIFDKLAFSETVLNILDDNVSFEVFSRAFIESLYANNRSGKFISGSVTFCSMIPMRSIPYRIIAVLGLNAKIFPRKSTDISFDLISYEHRKGDRNLKETDKYLFFETILSAKEKLYLSYLGINIKDNSELPPSTVIDELLDYINIKSITDSTKSKLIIKHPLDNYNKKYYSKSYPHYTFLKYGDNNSIPISNIKNNKNVTIENHIRFNDLQRFIKDPFNWYFTTVLNINYNEDSILLPETEVFELNGLETFILKNEIIKTKDEQSLTENINEKIINGELPLKNMGIFEVKNNLKELKLIRDTFKNKVKGLEQKSFNFEIKINNSHIIHGEIDNVYDNKVVLLDISSDYYKSITRLKVISWVCSILDFPIDEYTLIHLKKDKKTINEITFKKPNREVANNSLKSLFGYYELSFSTVMPFFPQASYEYLRKHIGKSRKLGTPYQVFISILNLKKEYNKYIEKSLEQNILEEYNSIPDNENNLMLNMAKLFFMDILA